MKKKNISLVHSFITIDVNDIRVETCESKKKKKSIFHHLAEAAGNGPRKRKKEEKAPKKSEVTVLSINTRRVYTCFCFCIKNTWTVG